MKQVVEVSHSCIMDKVNDFIDLLDTLLRHTTGTRTKQQFELVTFGIATTRLTLDTYNMVQISKLENKIAANEKVDHLVDITNLREQQFKAVNQKLDISNSLATMLPINKVHFANIKDLLEQKFAAVVTILERLIHTAYGHRRAARGSPPGGPRRNC